MRETLGGGNRVDNKIKPGDTDTTAKLNESVSMQQAIESFALNESVKPELQMNIRG